MKSIRVFITFLASAQRLWDASAQIKVADCDIAVVIDQNIGRLNVSVYYSGTVQAIDTTQNLKDDHLELTRLNFDFRAIQKALQVRAKLTHNYVERRKVLDVFTRDKEAFEFYQITHISHLNQSFNFTQMSNCLARSRKNVVQSLEHDNGP